MVDAELAHHRMWLQTATFTVRHQVRYWFAMAADEDFFTRCLYFSQ
jgi:hypothetical protein